MKRSYRWIPDTPDFRDHIFARPATAPAVLPPHVDLRAGCSPVEDQGSLGSCTGNAIVGALEFLEVKAGGVFTDLSRLFVYYQERVLEGTVKSDSGAQIRDGVKAVAKLGTCSEKLWPYIISKFAKKPTAAATKDALRHTISAYERLTTLQDVKTCLASGFPFVFGFSVYESFESDAAAKTGIIPMPSKTERLLGGHAVLGVGYDDAKQCIIVRNSWGAGWGDKGYFYLPFGYITDRNLSDDFWKITK